MEITIRKSKCPKCGGHKTMKNGYDTIGIIKGKASTIKQYYKCRDCGRQYYEVQKWDEKKGDYRP